MSNTRFENAVLKDLQFLIKTLRCESKGSSGGSCCPETNETLADIHAVLSPSYNTETEILLPIGSAGSHTIAAGSVHAYSVIVEDGSGTGSTIQIGAGTPIPIYKGYLKSVEFSTTNDLSVVITNDTLDRIRIIKIN